MSGDVTEVLAGFAASLQYDDLPRHVRDHCKNVLLDTLACAVAGHRGEETQQVAALASALAQSSESSVIGGDRLSLAGATILNGYLVTAVTMCDVHRSTLTHVTPEVIPPALATSWSPTRWSSLSAAPMLRSSQENVEAHSIALTGSRAIEPSDATPGTSSTDDAEPRATSAAAVT